MLRWKTLVVVCVVGLMKVNMLKYSTKLCSPLYKLHVKKFSLAKDIHAH